MSLGAVVHDDELTASVTTRTAYPSFDDVEGRVADVRGLALHPLEQYETSLSDRFEEEDATNFRLERCRTCDDDSEANIGIFRAKTWMAPSPTLQHTDAGLEVMDDVLSRKRRFSLQLPSFISLGISPSSGIFESPETTNELPLIPADSALYVCPSTRDHTVTAACGVMPPLTPPPEEIPALKTDHVGYRALPGMSIRSASQSDHPVQEVVQSRGLTSGRIQGIALPESSSVGNPPQLPKSPWIAKASQEIVTALNSTLSHDLVQIVSQTLPSQANDGRSRPTFEELLETLQTEMDTLPYITITHAVPQARIMEELPKTPPSTPSFRPHANDYFGSDQTIFTHAAVVPMYHGYDRVQTNLASSLAHHIAAPGSIHVSILERYIPPTMPQEIDDFFSFSTRSHLADRLSELSANNGSLLLVYPTRAGGTAFARQCVGPLIDPHLRQFVMLNGLTTDAAALMGNMTAINHMLDFEEMQQRVADLCQNFGARPAARGPPATFTITHSEVTNVGLDRSTWIDWFIEQEQSRIRHNLVEYHQAGGRMPEWEGAREVTVGMLTRDFINGLRKSQESAGNAEIEVGVFVITRRLLS